MNRFAKRFLILLGLLVLGALFLPVGPFGWIWEGSLLDQLILVIAYLLIGILTLRTLASLGDPDADE